MGGESSHVALTACGKIGRYVHNGSIIDLEYVSQVAAHRCTACAALTLTGVATGCGYVPAGLG